MGVKHSVNYGDEECLLCKRRRQSRCSLIGYGAVDQAVKFLHIAVQQPSRDLRGSYPNFVRILCGGICSPIHEYLLNEVYECGTNHAAEHKVDQMRVVERMVSTPTRGGENLPGKTEEGGERVRGRDMVEGGKGGKGGRTEPETEAGTEEEAGEEAVAEQRQIQQGKE